MLNFREYDLNHVKNYATVENATRAVRKALDGTTLDGPVDVLMVYQNERIVPVLKMRPGASTLLFLQISHHGFVVTN